MVTRIATVPGSNTLVVRDEFVNLKEQPVEIQILYHWNFGPPFLGPGSRFVAPIKSVTPRDARAQEGIGQHDLYGAPEPGSTEQVYYHELHAGSAGDPRTLAMLRNQAGDKGVVLRFRNDQLPAFTLWKNTGGLRDGYVTGLEPGTNYPERPAVREGPQPGRDTAGRRPLRCRDDPRGAHHSRGRRRGRGRDHRTSGATFAAGKSQTY